MSALERFIVAFEPKNEGKVSFRILLDEVINEIKAKADANSEPILMRDYFAAKAMQADITNYEDNSKFGPDFWSTENIAKRAYNMADAMIKAREE